jgi:cell division protein ZapA (FtsZ GTPase activity inhibitor)
MPMYRTGLSAVAVMAALLLSACSSATTDVLQPTVSVSIGQQLIDLKKAKDAGALSEKEYQAQVKRLIDSVR